MLQAEKEENLHRPAKVLLEHEMLTRQAICTEAGSSVVVRRSSGRHLNTFPCPMQTEKEEHLHRVAKVLLEHEGLQDGPCALWLGILLC